MALPSFNPTCWPFIVMHTIYKSQKTTTNRSNGLYWELHNLNRINKATPCLPVSTWIFKRAHAMSLQTTMTKGVLTPTLNTHLGFSVWSHWWQTLPSACWCLTLAHTLTCCKIKTTMFILTCSFKCWEFVLVFYNRLQFKLHPQPILEI